MRKINNIENALVLRTDFSNDVHWKQICQEIEEPDPEEGFKAYVTFLSDKQYKNTPTDKVIELIDPSEHRFIFVVDRKTISNPEHPILCIDFSENHGNSFRLIPSEVWRVENNLSVSNMDFDDFAGRVAFDGISRGFHN